MSDQEISSKLRAIAAGPKKTDTARLRDIFDDVEYALARKTQSDVLSILHQGGFKFTEAGFRYSLAKIRRERGTGRMTKKKVGEQHPRHSTSSVEKKPSSGNPLIINSAASMPAKLKPATPVAAPTRKLLCGPIPEGTPLMERLSSAKPEFSQEGDLEHPAIAGLILNRIERMATITLEYTDENGEVFSETPLEKRYRLTWRTPVPTTPSSTFAKFTKMDMSIFGNQSD